MLAQMFAAKYYALAHETDWAAGSMAYSTVLRQTFNANFCTKSRELNSLQDKDSKQEQHV